jgi:hypothetical protein
MSRRKLARTMKTTRMLGELALAAPLVATQRLSRLAAGGPVYSARDRREFAGMVEEKQVAFFQSWMAMSMEAVRIQQQMWLAWMRPLMWPTLSALSRTAPAPQWRYDHLLRIAGMGLVPVHRKALANARRLSSSGLR